MLITFLDVELNSLSRHMETFMILRFVNILCYGLWDQDKLCCCTSELLCILLHFGSNHVLSRKTERLILSKIVHVETFSNCALWT
ncbi:unnamed protein product [Brassica oleracea]